MYTIVTTKHKTTLLIYSTTYYYMNLQGTKVMVLPPLDYHSISNVQAQERRVPDSKYMDRYVSGHYVCSFFFFFSSWLSVQLSAI